MLVVSLSFSLSHAHTPYMCHICLALPSCDSAWILQSLVSVRQQLGQPRCGRVPGQSGSLARRETTRCLLWILSPCSQAEISLQFNTKTPSLERAHLILQEVAEKGWRENADGEQRGKISGVQMNQGKGSCPAHSALCTLSGLAARYQCCPFLPYSSSFHRSFPAYLTEPRPDLRLPSA